MAYTTLAQSFHPKFQQLKHKLRDPRVRTTEAGTPPQQARKCKYKEEKYQDWYLTQVLKIIAPVGHLSSLLSISVPGPSGRRKEQGLQIIL